MNYASRRNEVPDNKLMTAISHPERDFKPTTWYYDLRCRTLIRPTMKVSLVTDKIHPWPGANRRESTQLGLA